jgi:hypothetical protein
VIKLKVHDSIYLVESLKFSDDLAQLKTKRKGHLHLN